MFKKHGTFLLTIVAILAIIVAGWALVGGNHSVPVKAGNAGATTNYPSVGVATLYAGTGCGDEFTSCTGTVINSSGIAAVGTISSTGVLSTTGGITFDSGTNAVATTSTTYTLLNSDISPYNLLTLQSLGAATTFTLPATSTIGFIGNSGDSRQLFIYNPSSATTTVVAGGTGWKITTASSTVTTVTLQAGKGVRLDLVRLPTTDVLGILEPSNGN